MVAAKGAGLPASVKNGTSGPDSGGPLKDDHQAQQQHQQHQHPNARLQHRRFSQPPPLRPLPPLPTSNQQQQQQSNSGHAGTSMWKRHSVVVVGKMTTNGTTGASSLGDLAQPANENQYLPGEDERNESNAAAVAALGQKASMVSQLPVQPPSNGSSTQSQPGHQVHNISGNSDSGSSSLSTNVRQLSSQRDQKNGKPRPQQALQPLLIAAHLPSTGSPSTSSPSASSGSSNSDGPLPLWLLVARTRLELALGSIQPHRSRPQLEHVRQKALSSIWRLTSVLASPATYRTGRPEAGALWEVFFRRNASIVILCHLANALDPRAQEESDAYLLEEYHSLLEGVRSTQPMIWRDVEGWLWPSWNAMWWRVESSTCGMSGRTPDAEPAPPMTATSLVNHRNAQSNPGLRAMADDEFAQFLWLLTIHDANHGLMLFKGLFSRSQKPNTPDSPPPYPDPIFRLPPITLLDPRRCHVRPLPADVHCQFRAVADQLRLSGSSVDHIMVRSEVAFWLKSHAIFKLGGNRTVADLVSLPPGIDWAAYCDRLANLEEPVWGDILTLQAAAQLYRRQILVISAMRGGEVRQILPFSGLAAQLAGTLYLWHWDAWCFGSCTL